MIPILQDLSIAAGLFALLVASLETGFRLGRRAGGEDGSGGEQIGAIQGAILGLLGLLLAFSFAAAGARFIDRQDLIVQEANAIGTAYLRADLLDEPQASELRAALRRYGEHRRELSQRLRNGVAAADLEEVARLHARIWRAASAGVALRPGAMVGVLPPVNEVIDLHSTRMAAAAKRLPPIVMLLLVVSSMLAIGVMGYGCGIGRSRRAPLTLVLAGLIGSALWLTIDLDHPRAGLIQLNNAPIEAIDFDLVTR